MAIASTCLVFLGFARTYYLKALFRHAGFEATFAFARSGLHRVDAYFCYANCSHCVEPPRAASAARLCSWHFRLRNGRFGIALAFSAERLGHGNSLADSETVFLISLGDILTFVVFLGAGFLWRRNPEAHQRLMLLAVVAGLLSAAIPRAPLIGGHPAAMGITGLGFLFAGPIYDLITRHRIHPAYIWGCIFSLATFVPVRIALASTPGWHHIARWLVGR